MVNCSISTPFAEDFVRGKIQLQRTQRTATGLTEKFRRSSETLAVPVQWSCSSKFPECRVNRDFNGDSADVCLCVPVFLLCSGLSPVMMGFLIFLLVMSLSTCALFMEMWVYLSRKISCTHVKDRCLMVLSLFPVSKQYLPNVHYI